MADLGIKVRVVRSGIRTALAGAIVLVSLSHWDVGMTSYGQFCSVARAHEVLGGRWTLLVVRELLCGASRFNDIRRGIPRVSRTVLSERLQALVFTGAIARTDGPHGPEYELTEAGQELAMVVGALATWGQRWLTRKPAKEDLDLEPLMVDMQRRVHLAAFSSRPTGRPRIGFPSRNRRRSSANASALP